MSFEEEERYRRACAYAHTLKDSHARTYMLSKTLPHSQYTLIFLCTNPQRVLALERREKRERKREIREREERTRSQPLASLSAASCFWRERQAAPTPRRLLVTYRERRERERERDREERERESARARALY